MSSSRLDIFFAVNFIKQDLLKYKSAGDLRNTTASLIIFAAIIASHYSLPHRTSLLFIRTCK